MKKKTMLATMMLVLMSASAAQAQDWKDALSKLTETVVGDKITTETSIQGVWKYSAPDCQLKSDDVLSQIGGEALAVKMEKELDKAYSKMKMDNMEFTFNEDNSYSCKSDKVTTTGTYVFNKELKSIELTTKLGVKFNADVAVIGDKMSLTFKTDKLFKIMEALSGFAADKLGKTGQVLEQLLQNYDGMNLGFELVKTGAAAGVQKGDASKKTGTVNQTTDSKKKDTTEKTDTTKKTDNKKSGYFNKSNGNKFKKKGTI